MFLFVFVVLLFEQASRKAAQTAHKLIIEMENASTFLTMLNLEINNKSKNKTKTLKLTLFCDNYAVINVLIIHYLL